MNRLEKVNSAILTKLPDYRDCVDVRVAFGVKAIITLLLPPAIKQLSPLSFVGRVYGYNGTLVHLFSVLLN